MAQSKVPVSVSYADAAALQTWLNNLATDVSGGKVISFHVTTRSEGTGGMIEGELILSSATSIDDLTVAVEDA